ncbi:MAG: hypothetical protein Kow0077_01960 [Anaerolineae bacterium]
MPPHADAGLSRRAALAILGAAGLVGLSGAGGMVALALLRRSRGAAQTEPEPEPIPPPPIVPREAWGALPPDHTAPNENGFYSLENPEGWRVYEGDLRTIYRTAVIHHSANYGADDVDTLLYIQDRHRNERGWADVGYHFFVGKGGTLYEGRALEVRGTHVAAHNTGSVGICLLGNYEEQPVPAAQIAATHTLLNWLTRTLALTHLAGHREFNPETVCPGANLLPYLDALAAASGLIHSTTGYVPSEEQLLATQAAAGQS